MVLRKVNSRSTGKKRYVTYRGVTTKSHAERFAGRHGVTSTRFGSSSKRYDAGKRTNVTVTRVE